MSGLRALEELPCRGVDHTRGRQPPMSLEVAHGFLCVRPEQTVDLVILGLIPLYLQPLLRVLDPRAPVELLELRMVAGRFVVILTHAGIIDLVNRCVPADRANMRATRSA